jgi:hypothetical protein
MKKTSTYFNIKTAKGIETVDQINTEDFKTYKEFRNEKKSMLLNYRMIPFYSGIYTSQRCTNDWKQ